MYTQPIDEDILSASKLEITTRHYVVACALGSGWFCADGRACFPLGLLIALIWIASTFDVTYLRSVRHAWKVVLASAAAAGVAMLTHAGPYFNLAAHGGAVTFNLGLLSGF